MIQKLQTSGLFPRQITAEQQRNIELITKYWKALDGQNKHRLAYILATAYWEGCRLVKVGNKAHWERIVNVPEIGWQKRKYAVPDPVTKQVYFGRGFVQLTWKANYIKAAKLTGLDIVNRPDLLLGNANASAKVLVYGMYYGMFTGRKLVDYINALKVDFIGARRIINGVDKAEQIAEIAGRFLAAV